jgi:hypothetical protein
VILSNVEYYTDVTAVRSSATINLAEFVAEKLLRHCGNRERTIHRFGVKQVCLDLSSQQM